MKKSQESLEEILGAFSLSSQADPGAADVCDIESDPKLVVEYLKAQFVEDILSAMKEQGLNKHGLAKKLGKSRQYVGQLLNERSNITVTTISEIACALGLRASVRIFDKNKRIRIMSVMSPAPLLPFNGEFKSISSKPQFLETEIECNGNNAA